MTLFQYAILVMRETVPLALPSAAIDILSREIDGAHGDLIEAAEAGRLGRDVSRALWDIFYGLEDSFRVLHEETRLSSRYPWTDAWAMLRCKCVPIYKSLWKVKDFRRQIMPSDFPPIVLKNYIYRPGHQFRGTATFGLIVYHHHHHPTITSK
ncbi:hypothetical protein ARMGADRAFT_1036077 [Armillaria gallica]|uniref:Uncharacterized protein n=1 Tax=Armillaria gallica TaxID=47427 RepID=A0A2H3D974_ARMGA|nr:hypothetical protein ARMGADRAFT_1036077 [Armillaria gallica]